HHCEVELCGRITSFGCHAIRLKRFVGIGWNTVAILILHAGIKLVFRGLAVPDVETSCKDEETRKQGVAHVRDSKSQQMPCQRRAAATRLMHSIAMKKRAVTTPDTTDFVPRLPLLLVLFVGSGCAALIYEIVWSQMLELVIGASAISMGVLLGTFMGGM